MESAIDPKSGQHAPNHMAMNIREPPRSAVVVVGEPFVVEAEQVEDGRVEVVDVDHVFDGLVAELVGGTEAEPMLDARAGEPGGEALGVVVAARGPLLERGHAAELGGPDDERVVEQSAGLEVDQERGRGLVEDRAVAVVVGLDAAVAVPVEHALAHREGAVEQRDEPDPALQQPAGEQAIAAEAGQ